MAEYRVPVAELTAASFAPYGEVLAAQEDGTPVTAAEQALDLSAGDPRFYLMRLRDKPSRFARITRHRAVTQCLAAVGGGSWFLAVADPACDPPGPADIVGFEVPGDVAVLLRRGTWHAGPFFDAAQLAFFNLELADTNVVDHDTCRLDERWGVTCVLDR